MLAWSPAPVLVLVLVLELPVQNRFVGGDVMHHALVVKHTFFSLHLVVGSTVPTPHRAPKYSIETEIVGNRGLAGWAVRLSYSGFG